MPSLCFSNELISCNKGLDYDFASAVNIEQEFMQDAPPVSLISMNTNLMSQYIEFCADHLLSTLEQPCYYCITNPFPWMTTISLQGKTNLFLKTRQRIHRVRLEFPQKIKFLILTETSSLSICLSLCLFVPPQ